MRHCPPVVLTLALLTLGPTNGLRGEGAVVPPQLRTWTEKQAAVGPTFEQKQEVLRQVVRSGQHSGQRRLTNMFKDFAGPNALNPDLHGVNQTVAQTASRSRAQVKGASRTIVYAQQLQQDARFQLTGLNRTVKTPIGRTDHDIRYRHAATGQEGLIEVKDMSLRSQRANLAKIKLQMDKHALHASLNGELRPIWVNRYEAHPQVKEHGQKLGITVRENVRSGELRPVVLDVANRHAVARATAQARAQAFGGGVRAGMGAVMLYQAGRDLAEDVGRLSTPGQEAAAALRTAERGAFLVAGAANTTRGAIDTARYLKPTLVQSSRLMGVSRWSGRLGVAGAVAAEGLAFWQWHSGDITDRQFALTQSSLVGGLGGGLAGAWAGAKGGGALGAAVGALFGPPGVGAGATIGATIGGVAGGVGGGLVGSTAAGAGAGQYFQLKDAQQQRELDDFIYSHYGAR